MNLRRKKLNATQRNELLQVYLNLGCEAARKLCVEYGVAPLYAAKIASDMGISHRKRYAGSGVLTQNIDHADHRWQWAMERGPVVWP